MLTPSVRIDRPVEIHPLDAVENGLYLDLNPFDLRGDSCSDRLEQPWLGNLNLLHEANYKIEHMFVSIGCRGVGEWGMVSEYKGKPFRRITALLLGLAPASPFYASASAGSPVPRLAS